MRNFVKSFLVLGIVLLVSVSQAQTLEAILKRGEFRVGMSGNQPPFNMESKGDSLIGYEVDLANVLATSMGVKLKIVKKPFAELLPALEKGEIDAVMSGMTITPHRNLKFAFMGPYMLSGKTILTKSATLQKAESTEDLNIANAKIVVLKGSTSEEFANELLKDAKIVTAATYDEAVDMLINDKVDALLSDYEICAMTMLRYSSTTNLVMLDQALTIEPIGMAINAEDHHFMNFLENYFSSLQLAGILDELQLYWFQQTDWLYKVK